MKKNLGVIAGMVVFTIIVLSAGALRYSEYKTKTFDACMYEVATAVSREPESKLSERDARKLCVALSNSHLFKQDFEALGQEFYYDHSTRMYMVRY